MSRRILALTAAAALATAGMILTAGPASAAETCTDFVSDGAELRICTSLYSPSAGNVVASGRTIELHEYLRRHQITVSLQRQNPSGGWDTLATASDDKGVEEASATTTAFHNTGRLRACATGGLYGGHETATVCTP
ncbi:hypothetical protein [Tenggerimyces flavus]|uniref:Secreted protein n=1 Tax=Tenggerimyces flavus TaxID=1708749 RepID=A0ABV7YHG1_9ACTN|nr:hypothetical protein [Tenggerimyces flavus]MBM7789959.1 hypothetical protein [Tenggerimyces flavus]